MIKNKSIFALLTLLLLTLHLTGCVGGGATGSDPTPTQTQASSLLMSLTQADVLADNSSSTTITVTALDQQRGALAGVPVKLQATDGVLEKSSGTTDDTGKFSVSFSAGATGTSDRKATILATSGSLSAAVDVAILSASSGAAAVPAALYFSATPVQVRSDNSDSATITVTAVDASNVALSGVSITLRSDMGLLGIGSGTTDSAGKLTTSFSAGTVSSVARVATLVATWNDPKKDPARAKSATLNIPITVASSTPTVVPSKILLNASASSVKADNSDSTSITATAVDASGGALAGVAVQLRATTGVLSASTGTTNAQGQVVVSYSVGAITAATSATISAYAGSQSASIPITITQAGVTTTEPTTVSLEISATNVKSDNSDTTTITLIAQDSSRAALPGVPVSFSANTGLLGSPASGVTDASGRFSVKFSSGASNVANRIATVTARAGTKTASVPISISGSTLVLTTSETSAQVGGATIGFTATAKSAAGVGANAQKIRFSINNPTLASISVIDATTDLNGVAPVTGAATLTPVGGGVVTLKAAWLDDAGNETLAETRQITILPAAGVNFAVTVPATTTTTLSTGQVQSVTASVPTTLNGVTVTGVRFASSAGTWGGAPTQTVPPAGNSASATFTAPNNAGVITVQVDALNVMGVTTTVLATKKLTFAVTASVASSLTLQTSAASIAPSVGGNSSQATLTVNVRDASGNAVGGAAVEYRLLNTTGSGESIEPPITYSAATGNLGEAVATFTAGSRATEGPIYLRANIAGEVCTGTYAMKYLDETNAKCKTISMTVAQTAVNISLGMSTEIAEVVDKTMYDWKGSVLIVNANGSPAANAIVSLNAFPKFYQNGSMAAASGCAVTPVAPGWLPNEDLNRNAVLDAGEDVNSNGRISPPQATGGAITSTVTTDALGSAAFTLRYPKRSAAFIKTEITARVVVSGSEGTASMTEILRLSKPDAEADPCPLEGDVAY